jgi:branched-chain amino acid transport system substrate-binding protein
MKRSYRFAAGALAALALIGVAGVVWNQDDGATKSPTGSQPSNASGAPSLALTTSANGTKVGLIVSSSGPGADVRDLAAGAYVAAFRLNGATDSRDRVSLIVVDDNGTSEGSTAAMASMADRGVVGVVYASTGEHVLGGVAKAAELGLAVMLPYADDPRVTEQGATSFLTGPTIPQVAAEFVAHLEDANREKVALIRQAGAYGDAGKAALAAAGLTFTSDTPFTPGGPFDGKGVAAGAPDAIVVWAEAAPALAIADGLSAAGSSAELLFADRAAVPTFGHVVAAALAASVGDGVLSAGTWAGPDTPGAAADAFFLARDRAVADGAVSADLSFADFRSHDALLAMVAAAGSSNDRGRTMDSLRNLSATSVKGTAGAPLDFSTRHALSDGNVALLTYSTLDDGSGRYPAAATSGGHWIAVAGTFTTPEALRGLDNPYGG